MSARKPVRPLIFDGDVAYVTLTKGYVATIDATDAHLVENIHWCAHVKPKTVYAVAKHGGQRLRMHRLLLGDPDGLLVDHRDGDGLNNRRGNLRAATRSQNQHNGRLAKNNTSGFKGVSRAKNYPNWQVRIHLNDKTIHLGRYPTLESAHEAYCKASAEYHGEFGRTS